MHRKFGFLNLLLSLLGFDVQLVRNSIGVPVTIQSVTFCCCVLLFQLEHSHSDFHLLSAYFMTFHPIMYAIMKQDCQRCCIFGMFLYMALLVRTLCIGDDREKHEHEQREGQDMRSCGEEVQFWRPNTFLRNGVWGWGECVRIWAVDNHFKRVVGSLLELEKPFWICDGVFPFQTKIFREPNPESFIFALPH